MPGVRTSIYELEMVGFGEHNSVMTRGGFIATQDCVRTAWNLLSLRQVIKREAQMRRKKVARGERGEVVVIIEGTGPEGGGHRPDARTGLQVFHLPLPLPLLQISEA